MFFFAVKWLQLHFVYSTSQAGVFALVSQVICLENRLQNDAFSGTLNPCYRGASTPVTCRRSVTDHRCKKRSNKNKKR